MIAAHTFPKVVVKMKYARANSMIRTRKGLKFCALFHIIQLSNMRV